MLTFKRIVKNMATQQSGLIRLAQDSHQLQVLQNLLMNIEFHMKSRNFWQAEWELTMQADLFSV